MSKRGFIILSFVNTIFLFLLTSWFWSLPWLAGDEKIMIWATSAIKLGSRSIPASDDFALVNSSYDQVLIDKYDEYGFPVGNQPITDRSKLSRLVEVVNASESKPRFLFIDIFFEEATQADSALQTGLQDLDATIVSTHIDEDGGLMKPAFPIKHMGLSDYVIGNIFEGVYKFQLFFRDTLKLTPLKIHESLNGYQAKKTGPFVRINSGYTLNHFIMNYRVLQKDIQNQEAGFNPVNLGELLLLPDEDISAFLQDRIVIVGDFYENDMHETLFEITAGPVILLNALLSIEHRDTVVNGWFLLIISTIYMLVSFVAIYPEDLIENYIRKRYGKIKWVGNLTSFMSYLIILSIASIICYFLFNIHINVFFLSVYLFIVEKLSQLTFRRQKAKTTKSPD